MELGQSQGHYIGTLAEQSQMTDAVLSNLKRSEGTPIGKESIHELFIDAVTGLMEENALGLIIGGLPAGGKSRIKWGFEKSLREHTDIHQWAKKTEKTNEQVWIIENNRKKLGLLEEGEIVGKMPSSSLKVRTLVWADFFYLAQKTFITQDPENPDVKKRVVEETMRDPQTGEERQKTISDITPEDAQNMSTMMEVFARKILDRHKRVHMKYLKKLAKEDRVVTPEHDDEGQIDKTPVPSLVLVEEAPLLPRSRRGFEAARLVKNKIKNTKVIYNIGDKDMQQQMGANGFRAAIQKADIHTMMNIFNKYDVNPHINLNVEDPQKVMVETLKWWQRGGATPDAMEKIYGIANQRLLEQSTAGTLRFPRFRYNQKSNGAPPFFIQSIDDLNEILRKYPTYWAKLVAANVYPKGVEELGASPENVFIAMNHKQESVDEDKTNKHSVAGRLLGLREAARREDHLFYHPRT